MLELAVAVFLILLNGLFSLSELAVVSARKSRLKTMADQGRRGARAALALAENPGRFLSTVQIGITLIGILAGAFSGAALGQRLSDAFLGAGMPRAWAEPVGYGVVIGIITYLSVVVGELVPKTLALRNAEGIACAVAPLMRGVAKVGAPLVWLLDSSTKAIFRLLGAPNSAGSAVTDEELRTIMAEAETTGVIERGEHTMISGVLRLGDRAARAVMTPRPDVEWLDIEGEAADMAQRLLATRHSRLPVGRGGTDDILGVLQVRDLVPALLEGKPLDIEGALCTAPVILDTVDALDVLTTLRSAEVPMALVHDEYGHFEGVVTPADILDAIAGAFRSDDVAEHQAVQRADGSWLIAGWMPVDEMADQLGLTLPTRRSYNTAAGLILESFQRLPATGEVVDALGWRFEVVDLDGHRVDKILASRLPAAA